MKDYIEERAIEIAAYIIENNATVRQTAKQFGISKSTVHKDVTKEVFFEGFVCGEIKIEDRGRKGRRNATFFTEAKCVPFLVHEKS